MAGEVEPVSLINIEPNCTLIGRHVRFGKEVLEVVMSRQSAPLTISSDVSDRTIYIVVE